MFLLSSLGFIVGIGGYVFGVDFMKSPRAIVMAALFVVVGLFTLRRSRAVLLLGMVVYALEGILTSITLFSESRRVNVGLLVVHVVVLFVMFRGLQGIRALTAARTSQGVV